MHTIHHIRSTALLLSLCLLLTLFAACGADPASTADSNADSATFGSAATDGIDSDFSFAGGTTIFSLPFNTGYGWDPYECTSMENRAVLQLIYQGLFTMTPTYDAEPVLCSTYDISDNGYTVTIKVNKNATFSNGDQVVASDVIYSMEMAEQSTLYASRFRHIAKYEAIGKRTIQITMSDPDDRILSLLDFPIVPDMSGASTYMGTGPFVRASSSGLIKNENWWQDTASVQFDQVKLVPSYSAESTRDSFEINQVHLIYNDPISDSSATYHCDYELWNSGGTTLLYLGFNMEEGMFTDLAARSGVLRAIDRSAIVDSVYLNHADAVELPVSPKTGMYNEDLALEYSYDPEAALQLLLTSKNFKLPEDSPLRHGYAAAVAAAEAAENAENSENAENEENADTAEETEETDEQDLEDEEEALDEDGNPIRISATGTSSSPNRIRLLVCSGNAMRLAAAKKVEQDLEAVGFTVTVKEYEQDYFLNRLLTKPEEWDLFLGDATMTPDFDIQNIAIYSGSFNYGSIPVDDTAYSLYYKALENSGNRYDLYKHILDCAYICPILIENNAVYTTRGVFSNLNPAPGNIFYQIENITVAH